MYGPQVCGDLAAGAAREWLVPDGLGGYAMGTVGGLRTRRYHGLLVVAGQTPATRSVGLVALDPVLNGIRLGIHTWADGTVAPQGHLHLERFDLTDGLPRWRWRVGEVVLERELAMRHGQSCVGVVHRVLAGGPVELTLEALCVWRDQHGCSAPGSDPEWSRAFRMSGPGWVPDGTWLRGVHYREEEARGLPALEDVQRAGTFSATLRTGQALEVQAWAGGAEPPPASEIVRGARQRHRALGQHLSADMFVVRGPEVVAGYPWFGAWSRDTMISYEGLFLVTKRAQEGRELLRRHAESLSEGMLANTSDGGVTGYNTADATLWFLHAVHRHVQSTGDTDLAAELMSDLDGVVRAHVRGTRYGIGLDNADGLLRQGAEGEALTWMDARVDGVAVTPRAGKAVDINALWCNGLGALADLRERIGRDATDLHRLRATAVRSFALAFGDGRDTADDPALRPNQLLAWSLPFAPLQPDPARLTALSAELLTPLGLRSLSPRDPAYQGRHRGTMAQRDLAYHQGTVWPWLIGPYLDALRKTGRSTSGVLDGLTVHLGEWGLGSISETCEGDAPHAGTGCPFQAWSVAEYLRCL